MRVGFYNEDFVVLYRVKSPHSGTLLGDLYLANHRFPFEVTDQMQSAQIFDCGAASEIALRNQIFDDSHFPAEVVQVPHRPME